MVLKSETFILIDLEKYIFFFLCLGRSEFGLQIFLQGANNKLAQFMKQLFLRCT